jgi:hypothetical protein
VWRQGVCAHVWIVRGRCPAAAGEVMISERTVGGTFGFRLGGRVNATAGAALRIVGTYVPRNPTEVFWFG